MAEFELLLKGIQVILTASIAAVPILYPEHSIFTRRAQLGIEKLLEAPNTIKEGEDVAHYEYLEKSDRGFKEIDKALKDLSLLSDEVKRIGYVWGDGKAVTSHVNFQTNIYVWPNGLLYLEYGGEMDGEQVPILQESWSSSNARTLAPLQAKVASQAQKRAHHSTVVLTISWALLALILIT